LLNVLLTIITLIFPPMSVVLYMGEQNSGILWKKNKIALYCVIWPWSLQQEIIIIWPWSLQQEIIIIWPWSLQQEIIIIWPWSFQQEILIIWPWSFQVYI
jgi:hypothetical protein